jgi:hypothetical protein
MHAFTAPAAGTGKSMLVDLASAIATGREAAVLAQGKTEEEFEKRLGAMLLGGEAAIAIDNCEAPLGGELLCQLLTQPVVRTRILGKSEVPELPTNTLVSATGNNLTLIGDLTRRALLCRLDAQCERPELRQFDRDPVAEAKANRGRYLVAALTVVRAFIVVGRPQQLQQQPLGSFGEWSRLVRDALLWLGEADPVATLETARAADPRLANLTAVVEQWAAVVGDARTTARALIAAATRATTGLEGGAAGVREPRLPRGATDGRRRGRRHQQPEARELARGQPGPRRGGAPHRPGRAARRHYDVAAGEGGSAGPFRHRDGKWVQWVSDHYPARNVTGKDSGHRKRLRMTVLIGRPRKTH